MSNKKFFPIYLLLLILFNSCSFEKSLHGNWLGVGDQIDGNTWDVDLIFLDLDNIDIDYPDLNCGGYWTLVSESKKEFTFKETIEYGTFQCDQGVEALVSKVNRNKIKVVYYLRWYDANNPIAEAILHRQKA